MAPVDAEVTAAAHAWDRAMLTNDADAIGEFMADDWVIIGPDGSVNGKEHFLSQIRSGALTHDVMESHDLRIRVYADTAVVTARGISGGMFGSTRFYLVERATSVFVKQDDRWRSVLTHLSELSTATSQ